jgi:osmotically-inducible protein OsmY
MTATNLTDTDLRARDAVVRRLDWDPDVDSSAVGVTAKNGVVTLTGFIDSYSGKLAAERAAKRVGGVRAVANDIEVRLKLERSGPDVARDVARALELRIGVPETVQAVVHNGHVTLTGKVRWIAQKKSAERAVTRVRGVRGIFNHIEVVPDRTELEVGRRVAEAMHRHADVDTRHVSVAVSGDIAFLTGTGALLAHPLRNSARNQLSFPETAMTNTHTDRAIGAQIRAEYQELPGLRLTLSQAARLFNLELACCARVLDGLVKNGALWTNGREFLAQNVGRRCA